MRALLRRRYAPPEWAFLEEVRNQTGYQKRSERYADGVAVNLWPSRGLEVLGFEIKANRRDWVRELKDPAKSSEIQKYCDRWWIVAGGRNIVHPGELPPTWGLMVVHGSGSKQRLVCTQEAPKLEPTPLDRSFIMAMLRRASESVERAKDFTQDEAYKAGMKVGLSSAKTDRDFEKNRLQSEVRALRQGIKLFEESSGVKLNEHRAWEWGDIGTAVRVVLKNLAHPNGHREALRRSMQPLEACLNAMKALDHTFALLEEGPMGRKG